MLYEWHEAKNQQNIRKHGVSFEDATTVFEMPTLTYYDPHSVLGEDRHIAIGFGAKCLLAVVFTDRGGEVVRIISARKASKSEEKRYERGY
jgi:uncharacterized DUF497 family protein